MSRKQPWLLVFGVSLSALFGCRHTDEHCTDVPLREEWRIAPDEARFNEPPEKRWVKPPPKKEFRPGFGAGSGGGPGGMGGPGF